MPATTTIKSTVSIDELIEALQRAVEAASDEQLSRYHADKLVAISGDVLRKIGESAKPRTVEAWMAEHGVEPFTFGDGEYFWDGPESRSVREKERLPADVWDALSALFPHRIFRHTRPFFDRAKAITALAQALKQLGKID